MGLRAIRSDAKQKYIYILLVEFSFTRDFRNFDRNFSPYRKMEVFSVLIVFKSLLYTPRERSRKSRDELYRALESLA